MFKGLEFIVSNLNRGFRDRDFIESIDGLIFCVIGCVHPRDHVLAYLKYVPHMESPIRVKWSRSGVSYGRILPYYSAMGVRETMSFLKKNYPQYIVYDVFRSIELTEIPKEKVNFHYKPEERLRELLISPKDPLEELARELVTRISSESGVDLSFLGVTGSILLGIHNTLYSDIDLIVYGYSNAIKVRNTLKALYEEDSNFSLPKGEILYSWANDIIKIHPLSLKEALLLYSKYKWNRALYRGRQFSVHPVKLEHEVREYWEEVFYKPIGVVTIKAKVIDSTDSIFIPATYIIDNVEIIEGNLPPKPIAKVVSYEGLYIDLANPGEEVIVRGKLEEVKNVKTGEHYCQVTLGSFEAGGRDYLKPVKWFEINVL
ncbi:MAG: hypothetical protein NZ926_00425 [Candidatus Methanomethylicia archaeon]|nr:hypothetical protein [Candidatus Methanomethylicia archaeon]MCX8168900.1 hypothetical protein [Candidatus Methanomethylicia archaeon]MDW7988632.1 hypothetical protein [Nitrososphaerota archaeon]